MYVDDLYREFENLNEQQYTNTSRLYWHGSLEQGLHSIVARVRSGETVPLAWVTSSIDYAILFTLNKQGSLYLARLTKRLNIWNPRSDKDWNNLIRKYPEYNVKNAREKLMVYDWISPFIKTGQMRTFKRDALLKAVKNLNYDGVFNFEDISSEPALGLFNKSAKYLGVFDAFEWDKTVELWRSIGDSGRAYNPKTKNFTTVKEKIEDDNNNLLEKSSERQNFLEGFI